MRGTAANGRWVRHGAIIVVDLGRGATSFAGEFQEELLQSEFDFGAFPGAVLEALRKGLEGLAIRVAAAFGFSDENRLASLVFHVRHPERAGRPLAKSEPGFKALSQEWLDIRDRLVRPILTGAPPAPTPKGASSHCKKRSTKGRDRIRDLAQVVEDAGTLPGFVTFAQAAAFTESCWFSTAHNSTPTEVAASCTLHEGALRRGLFAANLFAKEQWCIGSGGWFGLMPATGLAAGGRKGPFAKANPKLIFEPVESVVMLSDLVRRLVRLGADTWLAVRRGMRDISLIKDTAETSESSREVRKRFAAALHESGAPESFLFEKPDTGGYPGAAELLRRLRASGL